MNKKLSHGRRMPNAPVPLRRGLGCVVFILGCFVIVGAVLLMAHVSGISACGEPKTSAPSWVCSQEGRLIVGLMMLTVLALPGYGWTRLLNGLWLDRDAAATDQPDSPTALGIEATFHESLGLGQHLSIGGALEGEGGPNFVRVSGLAHALWVPPGGRQYAPKSGERVAVAWQGFAGHPDGGIALAFATPAAPRPSTASVAYFGWSALAMSIALVGLLALYEGHRVWIYFTSALLALDVAMLALSVRAYAKLKQRTANWQ